VLGLLVIGAGALTSFFPNASIGVLAAGAFNGGVLARVGADPASTIDRAAQRAGEACPAPDCARHRRRYQGRGRFILDHPAVTSLVIGAASASEIRENVLRRRNNVPDAFWTRARADNPSRSSPPAI
jgi:D-threo-aldose 1-dehydrogenase